MENKYKCYFVIKEDYLLDESISLMLIKCYQVITNKKIFLNMKIIISNHDKIYL